LRKILIIRFSSIGDIVLTTPVIRQLALKFTEAEIHFLCKPAYLQLLQCNPYLSKVHILNANSRITLRELRTEQFDLVIDLQKSRRSILLRLQLGVKSQSFDKLNFSKWLMVWFKINRLPQIHIVDRYFEGLQSLGIANDEKGLDFFLHDNDTFLPAEFVSLPAQKYVAFAIGAQHFTKRLPAHKIIEICSRINFSVVLLGGKEDAEAGASIAAETMGNVLNACGKLSIGQSAYLLQNAGAVISHDTGMMHIAAALKKDIISVWGNTIPAFGMYPYMPGNKSEIVEVSDLSCRPCSKLGHAQCPKKHFKCMENQDSDAIAREANRIISMNQNS
jgi:ADP-heptose:LPS heptosyltransferase